MKTTVRVLLPVVGLLASAVFARAAEDPRRTAPVPVATPDHAADRDEEQDAQPPRATAKGEKLRSVTLLTDRERHAADPYFRWLVERIAAGTADNRVMRRYFWLRPRLEPFERPLDERWRFATFARLTAPASGTSSRTGPPTANATDAPAAGVIPATGRFVPQGPTNIPGRVTGLARPAGGGPGTVLASMADGGLWLTRDAGAHWDAVAERIPTQATGAIAADPVDPRRWFLGTGEGNASGDNYGGIGLLRTADGGRTWAASNFFSGNIRCALVDPSNRDRVYACGNDGLYESGDGGAYFTRVSGGLPDNQGATRVLIDPRDPNVRYAGIWSFIIHRSLDGGATWEPLQGVPQLRYSGWGRTDIALCGSNPDHLLFVAEDNGAGNAFLSTDAGQSWTWLNNAPPFCSGQCWYDISVAFAPDDCNTIYLGGVYGYISRDGGQSFTFAPPDVGSHADPTAVHVDHHAVLVGPGGEVVWGTDGGVYRSTDYGANWLDIGQGLPSTQYYGVCGSDVAPGTLAGGTQDNGTHVRTNAAGWRWALGGDGGMCAISGNRILGEYQLAAFQRSLDGGQTWLDATGGTGGEYKPWVGIIERDPQNADTLYAGTSVVYRTTNFVDTNWRQIWGGPQTGTITALAVSPVNRNVLWAGIGNGGVWRSLNPLAATVSFANVTGTLPMRTVTRIVPHAASASAAWVTLAGTDGPRVFFTDNLGGTWSNRTGDFPAVQINDLVVDPGDLNVLVAATDLGIFRSENGGATWSGFSDGLPPAAVVELFRHPADGTLVAGTHGRSTFVFRAASTTAIAVPDGHAVAGAPLVADRTGDGRLWLRWDTLRCTAERYNLFYGPLAQVASGSYAGSACDLPRGGETVIPMPPGSVYFVVAGATSTGLEGPHGFDAGGAARPNTGVGLCGVTAHTNAAGCP